MNRLIKPSLLFSNNSMFSLFPKDPFFQIILALDTRLAGALASGYSNGKGKETAMPRTLHSAYINVCDTGYSEL